MMKRRVRTTSHTGIWITKDTSDELICYARSWLLWRRWRCIKCGTLLTKVTTKLRVKPHVRDASVRSKWMRGIKVFIVDISYSNGVGGLLSLSSEPRGEGVLFGYSAFLTSFISFEASCGLFPHHEALFQRHGESDTYQIEVQTTF
jgi:hypothetical protein